MNKILSLLGFAQRAGKIVSGEQGVVIALRKYQVYYLIIAADSSENTQHKFQTLANNYQVPFHIIGTREQIGRAIGKAQRSVVGITDRQFSKTIRQEMANDKEL